MMAKEIREKFWRFFKERRHTIIPSASLIPENDPSVLFTTAGMHPLVPYLLGEAHPGGRRLANIQKCLRTDDLEEVGDATHLTFFEMLGNWSLGDYFKKEAIEWSYEFLIGREWLGLDPLKLAVSVFAGDQIAPRDEESASHWQRLGIPAARLAYLGKEANWWPAGGEHSGPQGPDTEMFYWVGPTPVPTEFDPTDNRWVEIWNDVFMEYERTSEGVFRPLKQKNVDTGLGLERLAAVLGGQETVFTTDLFQPLILSLEKLSGKTYGQDQVTTRLMRIVADHLRGVTFILGDDFGVVPSNKDQGYVARRLLRRAIVQGSKLGISNFFLAKLAGVVIEGYKEIYPELARNRDQIKSELDQEEQKFHETLTLGLKRLDVLIAGQDQVIPGDQVFELYATYGFPFELTRELVSEKTAATKRVDEDDFRERFIEHQKISRAGSGHKFSGGLADHSPEVIRGHTATHLLHQALRLVLGEGVKQMGSNITRERLRFDFTFPRKMTAEEIRAVEDLVNEQIKKDWPVHFEALELEEAKQRGAIGYFDDKYAFLGGKIKVYFIGQEKDGYFSQEICGGPHVEHLGKIKSFKIIKEEAVSTGVRRIKARTG